MGVVFFHYVTLCGISFLLAHTFHSRFDIQQVKMGKYVLEIYDIAGGEKLRNLWRHYFDGAKAMISNFISFLIFLFLLIC